MLANAQIKNVLMFFYGVLKAVLMALFLKKMYITTTIMIQNPSTFKRFEEGFFYFKISTIFVSHNFKELFS